MTLTVVPLLAAGAAAAVAAGVPLGVDVNICWSCGSGSGSDGDACALSRISRCRVTALLPLNGACRIVANERRIQRRTSCDFSRGDVQLNRYG